MMYTFKNLVTALPREVETGDAFALKIVAVAGYDNDWVAYRGPSDWSDELVASSGDKLSEQEAAPLFYVMRASGRYYRS